jgi:ankyrin repeat protein
VLVSSSPTFELQVLSWLLFARRPLSVQVLHGILQLDRRVQLSRRVDIIDICHNLVLVDPDLDTLVFCHPSVREFMLQQDLFSAARANQLIATICLQQCISGPASDPDASQLSSNTLPVQELYHYTAVYWPQHVRESENEGEKDGLTQDTVLFVLDANDDESTVSPAFLVWMEWIRSAVKDLPRYHQISSNFEPLLSTAMSPLFVACVFGLSDLLDRVFALNPSLDLEERSDTGHTGLYLACSYGHDYVVSKLLSHDADMNTKCGSFGTPFNVACFRGHAEVVQTLLAHKTVPRTTAAFSDAFRAACRGARENVALLLAKAFLPIWTESEYHTALQEAVEAGFRDLVEWLMSPTTAGPFSSVVRSSSAPDQKGSTAERLLHTAIKRGQVTVLRSLLRMKPHWQDLLPRDAMALASLSGHADMLLALHDLGVNVEEEGVFGSTLRSASLMGNERVVRLLLSWGVDPAASGSKGDALQAAAQNGHMQIVRLLLEEGADVNQTGPPRGTPIQAAAFYGHLDVVDLLLDRGADMYKGGKSQDALYAAIEGGHEEVAALLLKKGYRVAAGADLPHTMRGSLDDVQRPWEKKRTTVGEQRGIGTDDGDDGLGGPLLAGLDAVDSDEQDCDVSPSSLNKYRDYDPPDSALLVNQDAIGIFELSVVTGDIDMIRQLILRPDLTQYDVMQALGAAVTAGQLNSLRALLDEQAAFFEEGSIDLNKQLILACRHGHAHIAQYLSLLVQREVGGASLDEKTWGTALEAAVSSGDPGTVLVLLRCQAEPEASHLKAVLSAIRRAVAKRNTSCSKVLWRWLLQARASQGSHKTLVDACLDRQSGGSPEAILKDLLDAALWSRNEEMVRTAAAKMEGHGCDASAILPALASACRRGFRAIKPLLTSERFTQRHLCTGSYTAAIFGRRWVLCEILQELARRGFPFSRTAVVDRAFIGAAAHGHVAIIKTLLETSHLREKFAKFPWAITRAMIIAAHGGHEDIVQECLREGADVDVPQAQDTVVSPHWREDGALAIEVDVVQIGRIKIFFPNAEITDNKIGTMDLKIEETGPSPDRQLRFSRSIYTMTWTALQAALAGFGNDAWDLAVIKDDGSQGEMQRQERIVFLMLEQGCDPNAANVSGERPIKTAVKLATARVVQRLIESGVEIPGDDSLVSLAAKRGSFRIVLHLLQAGASIPRTKNRSLSPEMLQALQPGFEPANFNGHPMSMEEARRFLNSGMRALLRMILGQHSSQRARKSGSGMRAGTSGRGFVRRASNPVFGKLLVVAAIAGDNESVKLLIDHGVDVNSNVVFSPATALSRAAHYGHRQVMDTFLLDDADVDGGNASTRDPLMMAIRSRQLTAAKLMIDHGVGVNSSFALSPETALSGAAHYGHRQVMDTLLQNGADVDGGNATKREPLIMAIGGRQLTAVKILIEHGARPSPPTPGVDAYQEAVALDDTRILDFFLKHSGPPEKTTLVSAAADGEANHVALLLAAGARVDDLVYHACFDNAPPGRGTALYIACLNGHTKVVKQLLGEGANPNLDIKSTNCLGLPLTAAAGAGHQDIVRLLLDNGADPNGHSIAPTDVETSSLDDDEEWETHVDELAPTALSEACRNNHPAIVKDLLSQGATVSVGTTDVVTNPLTVLSTGPWSTARKEMLEPLLETASEEAGDEPKRAVIDALTEAALDHNCDAFELIMEYVPSSPYTLGVACICGSERSVLRCLDQGVDVNAVSPSGELSLHHAANKMHSGVVQLLIDRGAEVNQLEYSVEDNGQNSTTALMAALSGFLVMLQGDHTSQRTRDRLAILDLERIVHCLLDSGADPELGCDCNHRKALHIACSIGDPSLVNLLLDRGAKLDSGGSYHTTPLFSALDWNRPKVVRLLLERGADPNVPRVLERDVGEDEGGEEGSRLQTPLEAALRDAHNMVLLKTFLQHAKDLKISGRALIAAAQTQDPTVSELRVILESQAGSLVDGIPSEVLDILDRSWVRNDEAVWDIVALRSGDRARVDELRSKRARREFSPSRAAAIRVLHHDGRGYI